MAIEKGNTVKVEYEGRLETGEVFDSSQHGEHSHPIEFKVGEGKVIKGFEDAVIGMEQGQEKEIILESDQAYGPLRDDLKREIPKENLKADQEPKPGMMLAMSTTDGRQIPAKIVNVSDENITIDLNHPLAGKKLIFKIKIASVE